MTKNNDLLDIVKVVMAVSVVAIHTNVDGLKIFGRLAVPFFLITSSYLFFLKYNLLNHQFRKERLINYLKRLIFLFCSWEIIYIPVVLKEAIDFFKINHVSLFSIMKYIFFYAIYENRLTGWGASWYLLAFFWALPLFCYMIQHFDIRIVFIVCSLIEVYYVVTNGYKTVFHIYDAISPLFFPRTLIYVCIGYIFTKVKVELGTPYITICLMVLFFLENIFIFFVLNGSINSEEVILTSITAASIFSFCLIEKISFPHSRFFRMYSTFLYAGHGLIIEIFNHIVKLSSFELFGIVIVTSILGFIVWLNLTKVVGNRVKFLKYMT